ncbi:MAG: hypothetical protein WCK35_17555 [Chloroflexota bacterium]
MLIIADSSALIALATCDGLPVLSGLYENICVPRDVYDEVVQKKKPQAATLNMLPCLNRYYHTDVGSEFAAIEHCHR